MPAIKKPGPQACDCCGREFEPKECEGVQRGPRYDWTCPHCGFDSRAGSEFGFHGSRIGAARSVEAAELRRLSNQ